MTRLTTTEKLEREFARCDARYKELSERALAAKTGSCAEANLVSRLAQVHLQWMDAVKALSNEREEEFSLFMSNIRDRMK